MSVNLTEKAVRQIKLIFSTMEKPDLARLKIGVRNGGCSGLSYTMDIVKSPEENYEEVDCHGVAVIIKPDDLQHLKGLTLDYSDDIMNSGFKWDNPNATSKCGCGSSFSTKK